MLPGFESYACIFIIYNIKKVLVLINVSSLLKWPVL